MHLILSLYAILSGLPAHAATYLVNSVADLDDATLSGGICETAPGNGECTLRAALTESNDSGAEDTILLPAGPTCS